MQINYKWFEEDVTLNGLQRMVLLIVEAPSGAMNIVSRASGVLTL